MDDHLLKALENAGVEVERAIARFAGNKELYVKFLYKLLEDTTYAQVVQAMENKDFDTLLTAAHTLKGVCGNMGMQQPYQACSEIVTLLRQEKEAQIGPAFDLLTASYESLCRIIMDAKEKGQ